MHQSVLILTISSMMLLLNSCGNSEKNKTVEDSAQLDFNPGEEIVKWKNQLIKNGELGEPCKDLDREARQQWSQKNKKQLNGFPANESDVKIGSSDFDNDGKEDIIMYFNSINCTGHNGGTPSFAKIIFGDGHIDENAQEDIRNSILDEYNRLQSSNKELVEVTGNYLESTMSIEFSDDQVNGQFSLYTKDDAHCCPSYLGRYYYNPALKVSEVEVMPTVK